MNRKYSRVLFVLAGLLLTISVVHDVYGVNTLNTLGQYDVRDYTSAQAAITAACAVSGTVLFPATYTLTSGITVACGANNSVHLVGSPTLLTCTTGASTCITFGNETAAHPGYGIEHFRITGPGRTTVGSQGLVLRGKILNFFGQDVQIGGFEQCMHVDATGPVGTAYVFDSRFVGFVLGKVFDGDGSTPTCNTALHLEGEAANLHFIGTDLAAQVRAILRDGPAGSGADATFTGLTLNACGKTVGTAGVYVTNGTVAITNLEDVEGAYPCFEAATQGWLQINNIAFSGDAGIAAGANPFILVSGAPSWIQVANARLNGPGAGGPTGPAVSVTSASAFIALANNDMTAAVGNQTVNFSVAGEGIITGNRCNRVIGGTLTNVTTTGNRGC